MFPSNLFKNKHVLLGITGGIAAYKSAELIRYLVTAGAEVKVVMSKAAEKFISALTLETLSQNPVGRELFPEQGYTATHHVHLADWADAAIVAPASYNFIGKLYGGIADDLITTIFAAVHCPIVIAPAMNVNMWNNKILQRNIKYLQSLNYLVCPPEEGFLAEGYSGKGRLAPLHHMIQYLYRALHPAATSLKGKKVIITAGRNEEAIDPVRVITNRSSGKMGFSLAWEAFARGAEVSLIHGPTHLSLPVETENVYTATAEQMFEEVKKRIKTADIYISAAAISDYSPVKPSKSKMKKKKQNIEITLKPTTDILKYVGEHRGKGQQLIGFAVETDQGEKNALSKLKSKHLDMVVLNNPRESGAGFDVDTNIIKMYHKNGRSEKLATLPKLDTAYQILQFLIENQEF
jgi:phosphopantothenoylcysteine decarboxylase/phosphopantothenate--cysteine ligase